MYLYLHFCSNWFKQCVSTIRDHVVCWLILMAYQHVWGYVMPNGEEVIHFVYLYLYFLVIVFNNVLAPLGIMLYDID